MFVNWCSFCLTKPADGIVKIEFHDEIVDLAACINCYQDLLRSSA